LGKKREHSQNPNDAFVVWSHRYTEWAAAKGAAEKALLAAEESNDPTTARMYRTLLKFLQKPPQTKKTKVTGRAPA